jgi:antitoxin component of RelBE/YafQ-DinJ toxin-antitoxin module
MLRKEVVQIRIEEELKEKANLLAKKRHTTISQMIRNFLEREVNYEAINQESNCANQIS